MASSPPVTITQNNLHKTHPYCTISLPRGPITHAHLEQLIDAFSVTPDQHTIVLHSQASTLPSLTTSEERTWLLQAGEYCQAQLDFKANGGTLVSLVEDTLVGGSYFIHGLLADYRLVYPTTCIYPSLPPETYQHIFKQPYPHTTSPQHALTTGLITHITEHKRFHTDLGEIVGV